MLTTKNWGGGGVEVSGHLYTSLVVFLKWRSGGVAVFLPVTDRFVVATLLLVSCFKAIVSNSVHGPLRVNATEYHGGMCRIRLLMYGCSWIIINWNKQYLAASFEWNCWNIFLSFCVVAVASVSAPGLAWPHPQKLDKAARRAKHSSLPARDQIYNQFCLFSPCHFFSTVAGGRWQFWQFSKTSNIF